jgi:hypothetical protein
MYTFEVRGPGRHAHDGKVLAPGQTFRDSRPLHLTFPDRLTLVQEKIQVAESAPAPKVPVIQKEEEAAVEVEAETSDEGKTEDDSKETSFGKEVTEEFPGAEKAELKVFLGDSGLYTVTDAENIELALNKKPLKKKIDVSKFIHSQE